MMSTPVLDTGPAPRRNSLTNFVPDAWAARFSRKLEMSSLFGVDLDEELSESMSQNLSFDGAQHLMRAVRLSRVLAGMAKLFENSEGSAATYQLSEHATGLRYFLSHNWCVSRWDKYLALCYKFNGDLAFFFTLFYCAVCGLLGAYKVLPTVEETYLNIRPGWVCRLGAAPIALLMLAFGTSFLSLFGLRGPYVFLDKVCIHQVDSGLQRQGIARLGAFLRISDCLLILYSEIYFRKLWTIYEVANFLALHSVDDIEVVPVMLPRLLFGVMVLIYCYSLLVLLTRMLGVAGETMYFMMFAAGCIYIVILRRWARHKKRTKEGLSTFEVRKCTCAVEADRVVVYAKIADLMRAKGAIDRRASIEEGLEAFDAEVRRKMPQAFSIIFGRSAFSYKYYVFISGVLVLPQSVDYVLRMRGEGTLEQAIAALIHSFMWMFSFWPLVFFSSEVLASSNLHWSGRRQFFYLLTGVLTLVILASTTHLLLTSAENRASEDVNVFQFFVALSVVLTASTWVIVALAHRWTPWGAWRHWMKRRQRRKRQQAELNRHIQQEQPQQKQLQQQQQQQQQQEACRKAANGRGGRGSLELSEFQRKAQAPMQMGTKKDEEFAERSKAEATLVFELDGGEFTVNLAGPPNLPASLGGIGWPSNDFPSLCEPPISGSSAHWSEDKITVPGNENVTL